jgi:hypothetical protein
LTRSEVLLDVREFYLEPGCVATTTSLKVGEQSGSWLKKSSRHQTNLEVVLEVDSPPVVGNTSKTPVSKGGDVVPFSHS